MRSLPDRTLRPRRSGSVALVGAGPGDPRLLTLRGRDLLSRADIVVYDRLVSPRVLRFAPTRARLVAAEDLGPHGAARQREIDHVLVQEARRGRFVVRLKGGDPFVFGRGGEEVEMLEAHGISCEVVPGVTSAVAGPAAAGIPVTHREFASSVTIVTGHEASGQSAVPWGRIARAGGTIIVLMCSDRIRDIVARLRRGGLSADVPAAVVARATWPDQEVRVATLGTVAGNLERHPVAPPAVLVVGRVAALAHSSPPPRRTRAPIRRPRG